MLSVSSIWIGITWPGPDCRRRPKHSFAAGGWRSALLFQSSSCASKRRYAAIRHGPCGGGSRDLGIVELINISPYRYMWWFGCLLLLSFNCRAQLQCREAVIKASEVVKSLTDRLQSVIVTFFFPLVIIFTVSLYDSNKRCSHTRPSLRTISCFLAKDI